MAVRCTGWERTLSPLSTCAPDGHLHVSSTVLLIIRRSNCIIQYLVSSHSVGGCPVRRLRDDSESSLNLCTGRPPTCFEHCCAHHQEVKLYYTTSGIVTLCRWLSGAQVEREDSESSLNLCSGQPPTECDDTRYCVIQIWPPDDEHMCSKHVEAWNKLIVKQIFCIKLFNYYDKLVCLFAVFIPFGIHAK